MSFEKCPFCDEPQVRSTWTGCTFRCGTHGPDVNGEYATGHTCDVTCWSRLLKAKDAEITRLTEELDAERLWISKRKKLRDEQRERLTDRLNIAVEFVLACDQEKLCAWGYDHGLTVCDQYPDLVHLCGRRCLELLRAAAAAREG